MSPGGDTDSLFISAQTSGADTSGEQILQFEDIIVDVLRVFILHLRAWKL